MFKLQIGDNDYVNIGEIGNSLFRQFALVLQGIGREATFDLKQIDRYSMEARSQLNKQGMYLRLAESIGLIPLDNLNNFLRPEKHFSPFIQCSVGLYTQEPKELIAKVEFEKRGESLDGKLIGVSDLDSSRLAAAFRELPPNFRMDECIPHLMRMVNVYFRPSDSGYYGLRKK